MIIKNVKMIDVSDWDELVERTYKRKYSFQQQDGCKSRGIEEITVPFDDDCDYENDTVPEVVNGKDMGVKFNAWVGRDPKQKLKDQECDSELRLWWERNFYPDVQMVANDLHAKGLLPKGDYIINIDW